MIIYKPLKGKDIYHIISITIATIILVNFGIIVLNSYIFSNLLKVFLLVFCIYQLYYIITWFYLKYGTDYENVYIFKPFKKIKICLKEIEGYKKHSGNINGIKLSGFILKNFSIGKCAIKNIGITNLFITSNKNVFYLKTKKGNYAISPKEFDDFEKFLNSYNIKPIDFEYKPNNGINLHKDKFFIMPFILNSIIIIIFTLNPFILYLSGKLKKSMPLNFNSNFIAIEYGTGKQFAFNQMMYGIFSMAILFCMYYASYFYAKYDKKYSKRFIYISLGISLILLLIQIKILYTFNFSI